MHGLQGGKLIGWKFELVRAHLCFYFFLHLRIVQIQSRVLNFEIEGLDR